MTDKYSIELALRNVTDDNLWLMLKDASKAVSKHDHAEQHSWHRPGAWSILGDDRKWDRPTLAEVRSAAHIAVGEPFAVQWSYYGTEAQWSLNAQKFVSSDGLPARPDIPDLVLTLKAYAGRDRLRTEGVVRRVAAELERRGVEVKAHPTRVSSTDDGRADQGGRPAPRRVEPVGARLRASLAEHTGRYVVGVLTGLTVAGMVAYFGLGR
ncbi:hypothetical protein [uncultured Microbacterium sp.]|uniref:hypothetical protein n=1 Tax=uncultured Microbacterium sp. TaxID=191216 RepID=UPI0025D3DD62|nr:hypothetical protein [uncultured Microbacterium sp.]